MPVGELLHRISSRELTEWMLFMQIEPFGGKAEYIGSAIVAATVANSSRTKQSQPVFNISDFLPDFEGAKEQTQEQMLQFAQTMTLAMGGIDKRIMRDISPEDYNEDYEGDPLESED